MPVSLLLSVSAVLALLPATLLPLRKSPRRDPVFWLLLAVAVAGPLVVIYVLFAPGWRTGLSSALWLTVAVSLTIYTGLAAFTRSAWRLGPLLLPYLVLFAILATVWQNQPERALTGAGLNAWTQLHIAFALVTYGLLTVGAVAGLAVFLHERALKLKRPTALTGMLPSVADGQTLQVRLLSAGAIVLGCGLVSGMATQYFIDGALIPLGHKTLLSILTFAVVLALLIAHYRFGVRGQRAARFLLLAYLLLTLAYPGVKFVTDVVLV